MKQVGGVAASNPAGISRTTFSRPSITPGEQFFFFTTLVAWLLGLAGEAFQAPSQFDDPNASTSSILTALKGMGLNIKDVPPGVHTSTDPR